MSFSALYMERKTRSAEFYRQINLLIDWKSIETIINRYYTKAHNLRGEKPYSGLVLFKMLLIGIWNGLSDERCEDFVNDSVSAMRFCGLTLEDSIPDHSTLSRFRTEMTKARAFEKLLKAVNKELDKNNLIVNAGIKVDASVTASPNSPKGKKTYRIAEDRKEDELSEEEVTKQDTSLKEITGNGVDKEARWLKKGGKLIFGFKKHEAVDENGMVLGVYTTTANEHDSKGLIPLLEKIPRKHKKKGVWADKGYNVPANVIYLAENKIKNRIQRKAYRNRPLTYWEKVFNKKISETRYVVERTFGSMKRWFGAGLTRYKGLEKTHTLHLLEAICHNLKRAPGLVWANAK
jgi:IS5 family transposase